MPKFKFRLCFSKQRQECGLFDQVGPCLCSRGAGRETWLLRAASLPAGPAGVLQAHLLFEKQHTTKQAPASRNKLRLCHDATLA